MKILSILGTFALGACLMYFVPDKEKKDLKSENRNLRAIIKSLNKDGIKNESPRDGGITVLPKNTESITLKGFVGSIQWYQSPNFENLTLNNPTDFHPIGETVEISGENKKIPIPSGANAILRKNMSGAYQMQISTF